MDFLYPNAAMIFEALTAVAALVAAIMWWQSSKVSVPAALSSEEDASEIHDASIELDGTDYFETVRLQSLWNRRAAVAAMLAAAFQTLAAITAATGC